VDLEAAEKDAKSEVLEYRDRFIDTPEGFCADACWRQ
jgi:hypothetical protein